MTGTTDVFPLPLLESVSYVEVTALPNFKAYIFWRS